MAGPCQCSQGLQHVAAVSTGQAGRVEILPLEAMVWGALVHEGGAFVDGIGALTRRGSGARSVSALRPVSGRLQA